MTAYSPGPKIQDALISVASFISSAIIIGAGNSRKTDSRGLERMTFVNFITVFMFVYPDTRSLDRSRL